MVPIEFYLSELAPEVNVAIERHVAIQAAVVLLCEYLLSLRNRRETAARLRFGDTLYSLGPFVYTLFAALLDAAYQKRVPSAVGAIHSDYLNIAVDREVTLHLGTERTEAETGLR